MNRRIVDASSEPKEEKGSAEARTIRVGKTRRKPIPLKKIPAKIGTIAGIETANMLAMVRQGVALDLEDIDKLEKLARIVASLSSAHTRLNKPDDAEDPKKLTDEQLRERAT